MVGHLLEQADLLSSQLSSDMKFQIGRDAEAKPLLASGASGYPLVAGEGLQRCSSSSMGPVDVFELSGGGSSSGMEYERSGLCIMRAEGSGEDSVSRGWRRARRCW